MSAVNAGLLIWSFTVVKSNPSGNVLRFTITDSGNLLVTSKMKRAVLEDAFGQFLVAEAADLKTNGDETLSVSDATFNFNDKTMEVTLTSKTNIAVTGNITVVPPYSDLKCCCNGRDLIGTGQGTDII